MDISLQFEHDYEIEQIPERLNFVEYPKKVYYPGASQKGGKDGVELKVIPRNGEPWIGSFAYGHPRQSSLNKVMSCPNPQEVCVISSGAGYIVRVDNPLEWRAVRSIPTCDARAIVTNRLLVLSDFTKLVAYGDAGIKWEAANLSSDGITITEIADSRLSLLAWDAASQKKLRVVIDLNDGSVLGRSVVQ